jgi:hypothetical protein
MTVGSASELYRFAGGYPTARACRRATSGHSSFTASTARPSAPGEFGQADDRVGEGHHGGMLGVPRVGDAEQVRGDGQGPGDVAASGTSCTARRPVSIIET